MKDYFEIFKWAKFLFIILAIYNASLHEYEITKLINVLYIATLISLFIGIFQYFSIAGFDKWLAPFYVGDRMYMVNTRMMGTYNNPNNLGFTLVIGLIIGISRFLKFRKQSELILIIFLFFGIVLTGSRTGLGTAIIIIALSIIFTKISLSRKLILFSTGTAIGIIIVIVAWDFLQADVITRYENSIDAAQDQSLMMRFLAWYYNIKVFLLSPIIGWGPGKYLHPRIVDSEYIITLRRYGVIGFTIFMAIYAYFVYIGISIYRQANQKISFIGSVIVLSSVAILMTNLTNSVFNIIQLSGYIFVLLGIGITVYTRNCLNYSTET